MSDLGTALKQIFTLDSFADGMAGSMGGISAITVFYPLNIIRTQLQCDDPAKKHRSMLQCTQDIMAEGGIPALFKGWWGQVVALGASNFVYFYVYNMLKVIVQKKTNAVITPVFNLGVGALAGVINVMMTTPLWMVSTKLATQKAEASGDYVPLKGMWDGLIRSYHEMGIRGMWKSVGPNLILVSNPTIHFFTYERVRIVFEKFAETRGSPINSFEFFCMGAISKAIATVLTYPIQIAQAQLRNDKKAKDGKFKYNGTLDCLVKIYADAGFDGWFRGLGAKMWQTVLTAAFQFMTFEKIRVIVFKALTGKELKGFKARAVH